MIPLDRDLAQAKKLHAISFDAGGQDEFKSIPLAITELDRSLNKYGVAHYFEIYSGTHGSRIAERLGSKVLPNFSQNLSFRPYPL